jgi:hypothetical protein
MQSGKDRFGPGQCKVLRNDGANWGVWWSRNAGGGSGATLVASLNIPSN